MNFKKRHHEIREKARQIKAENDQLLREWVEAEAPHKRGDVVTIPGKAKIYAGMNGQVTKVSILLAGRGLEYHWKIQGRLFDKDGNLTTRYFRYQIKMEKKKPNPKPIPEPKKKEIIRPTPKLDPLISGRLV